ncbi:MAG: polysaccharide biosynthesis protein PelF [Solirubrobacteraceae bacterium]|jgi:glycosyltransferase involved in cell wall biosynthesis|nr:polysaccharide biosynthesis protein PelF [Solirubrobacteraceae bacterium]
MNDVCLVLEGTYPDLTGGVSVWVDRLVRGLGDVSFAVAHLADEDAPAAAPAYAPPRNLTGVARLVIDPDPGAPGPAAAALPEARAYHALSTGAATAVAARAARERGVPFLLTEHGLAWHEASLGTVAYRIHRSDPLDLRRGAGAMAALAREAYAAADVVTSVCAVNARAQVAAGVPRDRSRVIANPAPATAPAPAADAERAAGPFRIGLVGRVVAIKDVATFLRAAAIVAAERPGCEFAVIGPLDHEPDYADACRRLAAELEIGEQVTFTGETDPAPWYRRLDAVALTSISEAQPLALIEAMAAGVPLVATSVGGCRDLVAGAGLLVAPRDPAATARALLRLAADAPLRERLGAVGRARAAGRHAPERVSAAYRELYARALRA